jgi:Oligonucleotide/oligosaccharide-binding (OB)-fold
VSALRNIERMRNQFLRILAEARLIPAGAQRPIDNVNADNLGVVLAVISSSYPSSVASVQHRKRGCSFVLRDRKRVNVHPSSVNAKQASFPSRWLVFQEVTRSVGGVYLQTTSMVTPAGLLLFGTGHIDTVLEVG